MKNPSIPVRALARAVPLSLLLACGTRLAPFKLPRRIEFVERIPVTARGKTERKALLDLAARAPAARARRPQLSRWSASPHTS